MTSTSNPPFYGTSYRFAATKAALSTQPDLNSSQSYRGLPGASFDFYLEGPATLTVEAWWTSGSDRSTTAPFVAYDAWGKELGRVRVNQQIDGGQWKVLGSFPFTAGWNRVVLYRATTPGFIVVADAVRIR